MTEQEWVESTDSKPMLTWLKGRASDRKLRLFMVACLRKAFVASKTPKSALQSVDAVEELADGKRQRKPEDRRFLHLSENAHYAAVCTAKWQDERRGKARVSRPMQACMLRELFGNPFQPMSIDFTWLRWNSGTIAQLAQAIYDDKSFDLLPILADALEEAGCTNQALLNHGRQAGEHVRGCWLIDLLLRKR